MKIHPDEILQQNIMREIIRVDDSIQYYRNNKGCLYWILVMDHDPLYRLQTRLERLCAEYTSLTNKRRVASLPVDNPREK